jgi:hypothetical protein
VEQWAKENCENKMEIREHFWDDVDFENKFVL